MSYNIVFSKHAVETFEDIKQQIQQRWGQKFMIDFEQRTLKVLDLVSNSPLLFQSIPGNSNIRRAVIHKNCSMFYEIKNTEVAVLYFWDNRQEPSL